ncbi:ADP-forming succinate--CoA ligase subunit beta [Cupriavidus sp. DL-D2]|uniref:ADP-forming succinate--CoA ligase subunit beta n=1 Tax=Cupriavidus sp. DL-D2 TaxID=3144974 RepID=UPI003212FBB8
MDIHEHQAKELLRRYDVPVPPGCVAFTPDDAAHAARKLGGSAWVVKSQIHGGGHGAGSFAGNHSEKGGVRVAMSIDEVHANAAQMLGRTLITRHTGPAGRVVRRLYIEKDCVISRELYLAILIDPATARVTIMVSTEGGTDIDEVAAHTPEKILKVAIDPACGIQPFHARRLAFGLGLSGKLADAATPLILSAYRAFTELDASLLEIHPLAVTDNGEVMALDARFRFDDNALFRHPEIEAMRDEGEEDPAETEAARHALNYVQLDGTIGCMANGAGLGMATMDIVRLHGAEPANLLDIGASTTTERITTAFRLILADPKVKGVLVNIFGGVVRCNDIAEGVIAAAREVDLTVPLVVRLAGTNVDQGRHILRNSGLPIVSAGDLADAAEKIVTAVRATQTKGGR